MVASVKGLGRVAVGSRSRLLVSAFACAGTVLAGCGGGSSTSTSTTTAAPVIGASLLQSADAICRNYRAFVRSDPGASVAEHVAQMELQISRLRTLLGGSGEPALVQIYVSDLATASPVLAKVSKEDPLAASYPGEDARLRTISRDVVTDARALGLHPCTSRLPNRAGKGENG